MAKFISLGSGSSGNCYYISAGATTILIDAGISIRTLKKHLRNLGLSLENVDAVFITHDHADHIKAVGVLANDLDKPIYTTQLVHEGINRNYCVTSKLTPKHIHTIEKGATITFGDLRITPFDVPHDSSDCVGYQVEMDGVVLCLITDVGHVTPTIEEAVSRATHLVLEANYDENMLMMGTYPAYLKGRIRSGRGHMCNNDAAQLIAEHATPALQQVWLCHLSEENNHPELARKTVDAILRGYGLLPGVDFGLEILRRKTPSDIFELRTK
ncbi:MAG: MBL fold metallo-hydrolase [Bacteroidaceae bacterium]|nr:MBL fold metallo-hydrolase [Bacteroidaceae bacterium]